MTVERKKASWTNWSGERTCHPRSLIRPVGIHELRETIADATASGRQVTAAGSGHSFTSAAITEDVMLDMSGLTGVVDADRETGLVKVLAGTVLEDLNAELDRLGLAIRNLGDIDKQTVSGAVSTGTHGTGEAMPNLPDQVAAMEVVGSDGEVREFSETDPEGLRAARVAVGSLGVISSVTIKAVPAFNIHRQDVPMPLEQVLAEFDGLAAANEHFEFFIFPYTETALTLRRNRTDRPPAPRSEVEKFISDRVVENGIGDLALRALRFAPSAIPKIARFSSRFMAQAEQIDVSHRLFVNDRTIRFTEMEYCLPREHGLEALVRVLDLVREEEMPLGMPIECRVLAPDDAMLSMSYERPSIYLAVHQHVSSEWQPHFEEIERIFTEYGGRPHWGKRHTRTAADLEPLYPEWGAFQAVRDRMDPDRTFSNEYVRRVLGA